MSETNYISIKGARVNNLKNIDVNIPRNKLVVITGLSGSGKSSLAFDTLYAEGQRRYVESLSSYARQFLGRMSKPECDFIKGIPPAIAIEQKVISRNPRSTVGTSTEIYEYLRLLFARVGKTYSPVSGQLVKKDSPEDIVACMLSYPKGTRYTVLTPILPREGHDVAQQIETDMKEGFTRLEVNGKTIRIEEYQYNPKDTVYLLVDRMSADDSKDAISRLTDSAETAMYEGDGACLLRFYQPDGSTSLYRFSTKFEADGIKFDKVCIDSFFKMLEENQYKIQYRVMLARYRGKTTCPECHGSRLKKEALYVKVGERNIAELVDMPVTRLKEFFRTLKLNDHDAQIAKRLLNEINNRLDFLIDVGLGYLTLNRLSNSLSGGESQRINLATSLGSSLVGSLYILDEPSIGLHSRDTDRLIKVLRQLQQLGNTVVVVEHDEEIIRAADYIIDIGPKAGRLGGEIVYEGNMEDLHPGSKSYTVKYLLGEETIPLPAHHRAWNNYIEIKGARENNLKGIDVRFPLNVMTVVTGVSGSGKSTLVRDIFYKALKREYCESSERPGEYVSLDGDIRTMNDIEFVDQNPIGKSSRSNPVTYVKAYDEIRKLFAEQPLAKQMGYTAGYFSFNTEGGRCEECKGEGTVTVEMQFMADLVLECESCHGKRFKKDTLEVTYEGKNIYDVLEMTVNQAIEFFDAHGQKKIVKKLQPLQEVGLGYIKLGQSSSTLSGGENQRVKLAYFLSMEKAQPTIFVFDEPTTGLHFHDIKKLLEAFDALIERGHTVVIIEHNMDVIKCADYIIDLGPEGGEQGGNIVVCGTPEEVAQCAASYTGQFLKEKIHKE